MATAEFCLASAECPQARVSACSDWCNMERVVGFLLLTVLALVPAAFACNGYKIQVKKVETRCLDGKPSIFELRDFNVSLDQDCMLRPSGCAKLKDTFKTATVNYVLKSPLGMTIMRDTKDGCEAMKQAADSPQMVMMLQMFHLPTTCDDITPMETCGEGKAIDLSGIKDHLKPGSLRGEVTIKHEEEKESCVLFEFTVKK